MQDLTNCPLLGLPAELRNQIYEEVLKNKPRKYVDEQLKVENGRTFKKREHRYFRGWVDISILFTCRKIYNEASLLPFALNDFTVKASLRSSSARSQGNPTSPAVSRCTTLKGKPNDANDTNLDELAPVSSTKKLKISEATSAPASTGMRTGRNDWLAEEFNSRLSPQQRGAISHLSLTMPWMNTDENLIKKFINSKPGWALKRLTITLDCLSSLDLKQITTMDDCQKPLLNQLCSMKGFEEVELISCCYPGRIKLERIGRLINETRKDVLQRSAVAQVSAL
ncbi:MAG: hypothetical protein M1836_005200 [Candelina mexicana]|nr:MAG: hypothetical protein M1836_005200 [Candelina mexicana]